MNPEHLMVMLRQLREQMKRYEHLAVNGRARMIGEHSAEFRLRCSDCAFMFEFAAASFSDVIERMDDMLDHHAEARGGKCKFTKPEAQRNRTEQHEMSEAVVWAAIMGFIFLDLANRKATILAPKRAENIGDEDWQKINAGLENIKRELEQRGFTIIVEPRT
jgi:transcription elongation factor Elf1